MYRDVLSQLCVATAATGRDWLKLCHDSLNAAIQSSFERSKCAFVVTKLFLINQIDSMYAKTPNDMIRKTLEVEEDVHTLIAVCVIPFSPQLLWLLFYFYRRRALIKRDTTSTFLAAAPFVFFPRSLQSNRMATDSIKFYISPGARISSLQPFTEITKDSIHQHTTQHKSRFPSELLFIIIFIIIIISSSFHYPFDIALPQVGIIFLEPGFQLEWEEILTICNHW